MAGSMSTIFKSRNSKETRMIFVCWKFLQNFEQIHDIWQQIYFEIQNKVKEFPFLNENCRHHQVNGNVCLWFWTSIFTKTFRIWEFPSFKVQQQNLGRFHFIRPEESIIYHGQADFSNIAAKTRQNSKSKVEKQRNCDWISLKMERDPNIKLFQEKITRIHVIFVDANLKNRFWKSYFKSILLRSDHAILAWNADRSYILTDFVEITPKLQETHYNSSRFFWLLNAQNVGIFVKILQIPYLRLIQNIGICAWFQIKTYQSCAWFKISKFQEVECTEIKIIFP